MAIDDVLVSVEEQKSRLLTGAVSRVTKDVENSPEFRLLAYKGAVLADLAKLTITEGVDAVVETPANWYFTFPPAFVPGRTNYSRADFKRFTAAVENANEIMRELADDVLAWYKNQDVMGRRSSDDIIASIRHPKSIDVSFNTYALPNFLDSPKTGRAIRVTDYSSNQHGFAVRFNILDSEGKFVPHYFVKGGNIEVLRKLVDLNPKGSQTFFTW